MRVASVALVLSLLAAEAPAEYPRITPIVEAVQKTRNGIVTIKVEKLAAAKSSKESFGTGVIVDDRGYVVTNHHVVVSALSVNVILADATRLSAKIVAKDPNTDLAILRLQPSGKDDALPKLQALPLGPGSDLMVGETVIAVGSPYGYTHTVSTGIVSAIGRQITMPTGETLPNLIQTNASINPGNSGGPLLNINGEVIGINVALRDGAQGIAFAINADTVRSCLSRHLSALKVSGIEHGIICAEKVSFEGPRRLRLVVSDVLQQTPALSAGVRQGDEIVRVAEQAISNRFDLERALWDRKPGEEIVLTVYRDQKEVPLTLVLGKGVAPERVATSQPEKKDISKSAAPTRGEDSPRNR